MRILFIVASYQTNKDGVADYTALLAKECAAFGHTLAVLAWNDVFVKPESEFSENSPTSLRLSSLLSRKQKTDLAKEFIQNFKPDVVSIQMVCFGFHPRGFVLGLGKALKKIIPRNANIEIMFHELWLGLATNHPIKEKVYGWIQKRALTQFWGILKPQMVHVSNNVYFSKLKGLGLPVRCLPLPSNIPIVDLPDSGWIYRELNIAQANRKETIVLLLFGTIHGGWEPNLFLAKMSEMRKGKQLYIVSVGSQGYGKTIWDSVVSRQSSVDSEIQFVKLGFRSDKEISELLQFADFGICTTPLSLFGKSGTAMAMVEHGLPVIVTRNKLKFDFQIEKIEENYPNVWMWNQVPRFETIKKTGFLPNRITKIAASFLEDVSLSK